MKKKVFIIGASSPAAMATANIFLKKKYEVHLTSRSKINKSGFIFYQLDLNSKKEIKNLFNKLDKNKILFDSIIFFQRARENKENFEKELNVSIKATKEIINLFSKTCTLDYQKSVTILSSAAAENIATEQGLAYHISKAAMNQLIRYYAVKLGCKNIRVNGVQPALIYKERAKVYYEKNSSLIDLYQSIVPLKRMGTVDDIAKLVYFLSSGDAAYITGQIIKIDGGLGLHESASLGNIVNIKNNN